MPEVVTKAQTNSKMLRRQLETGAGRWPEGYPEEKKVRHELEAYTCLTFCSPANCDAACAVCSINLREMLRRRLSRSFFLTILTA